MSTKSPASSFTQVKNNNIARRLLFPNLPADEPLPPLLSGTGDSYRDLELELYDAFALTLRAFVLPWWSKISKHDKDLLPQIMHILMHVVRSFEARLLIKSSDLIILVLHDTPTIFYRHYADFRNAQQKHSSSYANGGSSSIPQIFHAIQAHVAVKPDGSIDETYLRVSIEHVMKACLPPEDWSSETERAIVREVIVNLLAQFVFGRLVQPWFWTKVILDLIGPPGSRKTSNGSTSRQNPWNLYRFVVLFLSALQQFSSLALSVVSITVWLYHLIVRANRLPCQGVFKNPNLSLLRPTISLLSEALTMRSRHTSSAIISSVYGLDSFCSPLLNSLIYHLVKSHVTQETLTKSLSSIKDIVFSNNGYPPPRPEDPTIEEQIIMAEQLEKRLYEIGSSFGASLIVGQTRESRSEAVSALIEPFSSPPCNAHLFIFIYDAILLTLFPELGLGTSQEELAGNWSPAEQSSTSLFLP